MNPRTGLLLGLPVLAFLGWLLWTEVLGGNDFAGWQSEWLPGAQQISPDWVSEWRAGSLADYPGYAYRLSPQDEGQYQRERSFWEQMRAEREAFDTTGWPLADRQAFALLERLETSQLALPWLAVASQALHPVHGWQQRSLYLLAYQHHIGSTEDCDGYIYRLREYPSRLEEALKAQEAAAAAGYCDTALFRQTARQLRNWAAIPFKEQLLYRSLATRMTRLDPTAINEYKAIDYLQQTASLLEETLMPAWLAAAERLEQLSCGAGKPFPLAGDDFLNRAASRAGLPAPDPAILASLQAAADSLKVPSYSPSPAAAIDLRLSLLEIAQATEGIYPKIERKVRLQQVSALWISEQPKVVAGTRDTALFPIVVLPDSGQREELILDLYQFGVPGAAWMQQWLVESSLPHWRLMAHNRDQQAGWGLAALELMHTRILWFSRDSALLEAYHRRMAKTTALAWLDVQIHAEQMAADQAVETLRAAGWRDEDLSGFLRQVQNAPGEALARWLVWQHWRQQLAGCEGDVRACLGEILGVHGEVGR